MSMSREDQKKSYEYYKSHGICVKCWRRDARPGKVCCEVCAAESNRRSKEWRQKKRESGLCLICGKAPAMEGHSTCRSCMDKMNQRRIEERRVAREERKRQEEL